MTGDQGLSALKYMVETNANLHERASENSSLEKNEKLSSKTKQNPNKTKHTKGIISKSQKKPQRAESDSQ